MKIKFIIVSIVLGLTIFLSCKEDNESLEFRLSGSLFGKVQTFDEFGMPMQNHSGVLVTVEGTDPLRTTITDSLGNYSLNDLKTGTYNLIYSKDNFQTRKLFSYTFIGGSIPTYQGKLIYLSEISTTSIAKFSIFVTEENNPDTTRYTMVKVEHRAIPESSAEKPRKLSAYLGTSSDVSLDNYDYKLSMGTSGNSTIIRLDKLPDRAIFYAIMYPVPAFCNPYYDPILEKYDYSCYGEPSEVVSFQIH